MSEKWSEDFAPRLRVDCGSETRTKQAFKDECDINVIMRRYVKTGVVSHGVLEPGSYGFAPSFSFHDAMNSIRAAEEAFADLPAAVRKRFRNDPGEFLEFAENPENLEEMRKLGLAEPAPPKEATGDPGAEPPAPAKPAEATSEAST